MGGGCAWRGEGRIWCAWRGRGVPTCCKGGCVCHHVIHGQRRRNIQCGACLGAAARPRVHGEATETDERWRGSRSRGAQRANVCSGPVALT
ncbi:hypothetical protein E2C01_008624 [Portunus trituberculatus]|uniref:Uncharacterized protein n=1 Tax=Portunus trituberculatus TaxID=210409 RepID=A0A5B7D3L8_PORTR|nr:hypothetical protein [Portunus trituberculatus]